MSSATNLRRACLRRRVAARSRAGGEARGVGVLQVDRRLVDLDLSAADMAPRTSSSSTTMPRREDPSDRASRPAYFHQADSFAMMQGGHLDICVPGAYQVSKRGDLANWHTGQEGNIPAVRGAMDLAIAAKQRLVMMSLLTRAGKSKIVAECTYPLTGVRCVSRIYTDLAVFVLDRSGVTVRETFGIFFAELTDLVPRHPRPS